MAEKDLNTSEKNKETKRPDPKQQKKNPLLPGGANNNTIWIVGGIAVILIGLQFLTMGGGAKEITQKRFENQMLLKHYVEKVTLINHERAEIYVKEASLNEDQFKDSPKESSSSFGAETGTYYFNIGTVESFEKRMFDLQKDFSIENRVPISFDTRADIGKELMGWVLPLGIIILIWVFILKRMAPGGGGGGGIFNIGKSKAKVFDPENAEIQITFADVAGLEEAKIEVEEIVDFLKRPEKYTALGAKIPKGALLVGPPGTGKTLLAKAVAGEAGVPFFALSGSDFVEMFVGVGASRVRDLFSQAKQKAPCIIFIDEIDAVGRARGKGAGMSSNDERESTLNQLLTEMDGFETNAGVILLAATNRADVLDAALLRAGRFDRQIHVDLPDLYEREQIFEVHLKPLKKSEKLDSTYLAKQTPGFSGADIANVCNEAALIAARKEKKTVDKEDFLSAVDRIIGGLEKRSKIITKSEKRTIAFHESGHASVSWMLEHAHPLIKVTIVPRGQALGAAWYQPQERQITTKEQMLDELCSTLAGRAAEEITFGRISTGAMNDLEKVTKQAYAMIAYYGMSETVGNVCFYDSSGQNEFGFQKPYSEKTAEAIDKEVKELIDTQYKRAKEVLLENIDAFNQLANQLLEKEVIFKDDLIKIFGERTFNDEYEDERQKMVAKLQKEAETKKLKKEDDLALKKKIEEEKAAAIKK